MKDTNLSVVLFDSSNKIFNLLSITPTMLWKVTTALNKRLGIPVCACARARVHVGRPTEYELEKDLERHSRASCIYTETIVLIYQPS